MGVSIPFYILMGRPFPTPWVKGRASVSSLGDMEVILDDYVISLIDKLNSVCANVSLSLPIPLDKPTHNFVPGKQVLIRSLKPVAVGELRYLGPAVVIAVTRTGVLTDHQPQWIHASRLKHLSTYALPIDIRITNFFFDRFLKYLFSLYYDRWSNKLLSTVCFHSIQLACLFVGHWTECGIVCFVNKIKNIFLTE